MGILAVAKRLDLSPVVQRLNARGIDAALRTRQGTVALAGDMSGRSLDAPMALRGPAADGAELVAGKVRRALGPRIAAWTMLLLALAVAGWLWRRDALATPRRARESVHRSSAMSAPLPMTERRPTPTMPSTAEPPAPPSAQPPLTDEPLDTAPSPEADLTPIQAEPTPIHDAPLPAAVPAPMPLPPPPPPPVARRLPSPAPLPPPSPSLPPPLRAPAAARTPLSGIPARTPLSGIAARTPISGTPVDEPGSRPSTLTPAAGKPATGGIPGVDRPRQRSLSGHVDVSLARSGLVAMAPRGAALPAPAGSAAVPDPRSDEYRALFAEFVALRRTTGEPVEGMTASQFVELLREKRIQLIKELAVKDVRFKLAFQNGKAAIRYQTLLTRSAWSVGRLCQLTQLART